MATRQLFFAVLILFSFIIGGNADGEGCNGMDHGISCCYKGFSIGDNENDGIENFIQANQYNIGCFESCKKLYPESNGITVSLHQKYQSGNGTGRNKCWCEFGTPKLNAKNKDYKTCLFAVPQALALTNSLHVIPDPEASKCQYNKGYYFGYEGGRIKAFPKINVGKEMNISLSIKPQKLSGMLVGVRGPKDYAILELVEGRVVFRVESGLGVFMTSYKPNQPLNDGGFHEINALKQGNALLVSVDKVFGQMGTGRAGKQLTDTDNPLFIGGHARPDLISSYPGTFQGCIKDIFITNKLDNSVNNQLDVTRDMVFGDVTI